MCKILYEYLLEHSYVYEKQSGYQAARPTDHSVI